MSGAFGKSSTQSVANQSKETFVDPAQQPYLDQLRSQGQLLGQQQLGAGGAGDAAFGQQQQLQPYAQGGISRLSDISRGATGGQQQLGQVALGQGHGQSALGSISRGRGLGLGALGDVATGQSFGQQQLARLSGPGNVGQQIDTLGRSLGDLFNEQLVPGIRQGAIQAGGQLGGSRDQLGRATAAGDIGDAFASGVAQIGQQDLARQGQAAGQFGQNQIGAGQGFLQSQIGAAGQFGQNQIGAGQALGQSELGGAAALPGSIDQAFGLSQSPFAAQFAPLLGLSEIIGGPTVLGTSRARTASSGSAISFSAGA